MKEYVKTILYAYPLLKTIEKDYQEHIVNKAILSYRGQASTMCEAEYLAKEIMEKRNLAWLKTCVEEVLLMLSDTERTLIAVRYFGRVKKIKKGAVSSKAEGVKKRKRVLSERTYFRVQNRLVQKLAELLAGVGLSERAFDEMFGDMALFKQAAFFRGQRENTLSNSERAWFT